MATTSGSIASPCSTRAAGPSLAALILALAAMIGGPARAMAQAGSALPADGTSERAPTEAELQEARHSFELARRAFDAGDYDTAADEFRAAHALMRHPDLLFNLYLAEERAGHAPEAAEALSGYLEGGTVAPDQRTLLEARLARLRARIERAARGATETETAEDELSLTAPTALDAPMEAAPTTSTDVDGDRAASSASGGGPPTAAVATLIVAGVLAASFAVLAAVSEVEDSAIAAECGRDVGRWCGADRVGTLEALNIAADASWIAAAAAGAVGLVLLFVLPSEGEPSPHVALAPWASPDGAGVMAGGRF